MKTERQRYAQSEANRDLRAAKRLRGMARSVYPSRPPMRPGSVRSHDEVYFMALRDELAKLRFTAWENPQLGYVPSRQVFRRGTRKRQWTSGHTRGAMRNTMFDRVSHG